MIHYLLRLKKFFETDSEVIQKFLSNKNDALAPIDNYLDETSLIEIEAYSRII